MWHVGSLLHHVGLFIATQDSLVMVLGLSSCGSRAPQCMGFSSCGAWASMLPACETFVP